MCFIHLSKRFSLLCCVVIKINANSFIVHSPSHGIRKHANIKVQEFAFFHVSRFQLCDYYEVKRPGQPVFEPWQRQIFRRAVDPPTLQSSGTWISFSLKWSNRLVKLITAIHLMLRLRILGALGLTSIPQQRVPLRPGKMDAHSRKSVPYR